MLEEKIKKEIDEMSYRDMLFVWRFGKSDDPRFVGELGKYFCLSMAQKEDEIEPGEKTRISKEIGW